MDEALAAPPHADPVPPLPPPPTPEHGARDLVDLLAMVEAFGQPPPSSKPIEYHDMRM